MNAQEFISCLNKYKPTEVEIQNTIDDFSSSNEDDLNFLNEIKDSYDYKFTNQSNSINTLIDIIENTNTYDKGIGEVHFVKKIELKKNLLLFAYTERELDLFVDINTGKLYSRDSYFDSEFKLIANSINDFLNSLCLYFKMHVDFVYRKQQFDIENYRHGFNLILGNENAWFFNEFLDSVSD